MKLPAELQSVEVTSKVLAAAIDTLKTPGLDRTEVLRLGKIIAGCCREYSKMLAEYMDYRGIEAEL